MLALHKLHEELHGSTRSEGGREFPASYGDTNAEVKALRRQSGWIDRSARGRIQITGPDRTSYLQALVTNDVAGAPPGHGVYALFLNSKGRTVADARIYPVGDRVILDVEPVARETVLAYLDRYHFTEKVEFVDISDTTAEISVLGPQSPVLFNILFPGHAMPRELECVPVDIGGTQVMAVGNELIGESGFDLLVPSAQGEEWGRRLLALNCRPVGWDALEIARIEAGVPRYGVELTQSVIPLEAGLASRAISFKKGCYVGQEIIARIDSRGEPSKRLAGLSVEGDPPAPGTPILQGGREVGSIASSAVSVSLRGRPIALGYLHKDVADRADDLKAGNVRVWVVPLPFFPPQH